MSKKICFNADEATDRIKKPKNVDDKMDLKIPVNLEDGNYIVFYDEVGRLKLLVSIPLFFLFYCC